MTLSVSEKEELDSLRIFAAKAMMNSFDRAFFDLQRLMDSPLSNRADVVLGKAILELKREIMK